MEVSKKEFKEKGWKYQGNEDPEVEAYKLGKSVTLLYCKKANVAKVNVIKFSGKEQEIAHIKDFDKQRLSDATEILELNYIELLKQLLKGEE